MLAALAARGLSFELPDGRALFQNIDLSLDGGLTGLVGPNGAGKTTLARLLCGELAPASGTIRREGPVTFFPQRLEPPPVSVEAFLGPGRAWSLEADRLLRGLDLDAPCARLSGGEWMRARLAAAVSGAYLVLDEPTNDLDGEGRAALFRFLRGRGGGALVISHDRECLGLCGAILELSNRGLARYGGGWEAYAGAREREREGLGRALAAAERARDAAAAARVEQRERQERRNRQGGKAAERGGLPKILLGARKRGAQESTGRVDASTQDKAAEAARRLGEAFRALKADPVMHADLAGRAVPAQRLVAEALGFNVRRGGRWLYARDLDFAWRGNARVAVRGANGSGKSTLLKALLGEALPGAETRGALRRGNLNAAYVDQRGAFLDPGRSVFDNVRAASSLPDADIRNGLARFLFTKEAAFREVKDLSGGERLRAALARAVMRPEPPELLVLDEPTNNLDLANIEFLEEVVRGFRGALILVSHDAAFVEACGLEETLML
jgi:ATPase subunit of ABC transporter with duplicated ATPase domains